jgi:hypothetical protein
MSPLPKALVQAVRRKYWDAELAWVARHGPQMLLAVEPACEADETVARALRLKLVRHEAHPGLRWTEVMRNTGEES